jgi:hypothetical protein
VVLVGETGIRGLDKSSTGRAQDSASSVASSVTPETRREIAPLRRVRLWKSTLFICDCTSTRFSDEYRMASYTLSFFNKHRPLMALALPR